MNAAGEIKRKLKRREPKKMSSASNPKNKSEEIQSIDSLQSSVARLRPDVRKIIREEIRSAFEELLRELRKPKKYVEVGYR